MVQMRYTVKCTCGASKSNNNESGDSDRWMNAFSCQHFHASIYHWSKLGWLFGGNAKVSVAIDAKCNSCSTNHSWEHTYWGYSVGDSRTSTMTSCKHTLTFWSQEH